MSIIESGNWNEMPWVELREGVKRVVFGTSSEFASYEVGEYTVGHALRPHSHSNEQMSVCLQGCCDYYVDGKPYSMKAGSWIIIPPGLSHFIYAHQAGKTCIMMDVATPTRPDRADEYRRGVEKLSKAKQQGEDPK